MARFQPDTLWDMALRPLAMAAPDANVYIEIMAPDLRFVFAAACLLALLALRVIRPRRARRPAVDDAMPVRKKPLIALCVLLAAMFAAWVATTGNGRYFTTGLIVVGVVCAALVAMLPFARSTRLAILTVLCAMQGFAVQQSGPWHAWTMARWSAPPYFQIDIPADLQSGKWTFMTVSAISYSLLAPQFNPGSRWISLHNAPGPRGSSADSARTARFLAETTGRMQLLVPASPALQADHGLPTAAAREALNSQIAKFDLQLVRSQECRFLRSSTLSQIGLGEPTLNEQALAGFWACPVDKMDPAEVAAQRAAPLRYDAVFKALESQCPRFFPSGGDDGSVRMKNGEMRSYMLGEMKVYVYDDGSVYYKYYRALNAVRIGALHEVQQGQVRVDCEHIRGRSGMPWSRGL